LRRTIKKQLKSFLFVAAKKENKKEAKEAKKEEKKNSKVAAVPVKKEDNPAEYDKKRFLGWKTQFRDIKPGVALEADTSVFYGLGNCPDLHTVAASPPPSNSSELLLDLFLDVTRTKCLSSKYILLRSLVDSKILENKEGAWLFTSEQADL